MKAIILAAGNGTRLQPFTNTKPKALVDFGGITLLENAIKKLENSGFSDIIINVHHFAEQIKTFINNKTFNSNIYISDESSKLLDTGGAIKNAINHLNNSNFVLIHNVDIITNLNLNELISYHTLNCNSATLAVKNRKTSRYFIFDKNNYLVGWENILKKDKILLKHSCETDKLLAFSGIHIINTELFKFFPQKDSFSIVDFYLSVAQNFKIRCFNGNYTWFDAGKAENYEEAKKLLKKQL